MFFTTKTFVLSCILYLNFIDKILTDDVPVILWNINGDSLNVKPISALGNNEKLFSDSLKDVFENSRVLVLALDELSLEDFSANDKSAAINDTLQNIENFLDVHPHMLLPSVKDPLEHIHKAHCGVQEIIVDQTMDENFLKSVSSAFDGSCIVILHISETSVTNKEQMKKVFLPSIGNDKENLVGIFTAEKSSWSMSGNEHYAFRNLLQVPEASSSNFINITGCLLMYGSNASISLGKNGNISLPFPPDTTGSACGNESTLQLTFKPSEGVTSVVLKLNFQSYGGSWETKASVDIEGGEVPGSYVLEASSMSAAMGFSYSCGDLKLRVNMTEPSYLLIQGFQVQPFEVSAGVFSESFDCVPFFTIPIWMGIFVSLLFIIIINIGVYALFSIHTMDQFDDPKGKTITVAITD